jgi:hypothetical protein
MNYGSLPSDNRLAVAGSGSIETALTATSFTIAEASDEDFSNCGPAQIISQRDIRVGQ